MDDSGIFETVDEDMEDLKENYFPQGDSNKDKKHKLI